MSFDSPEVPVSPYELLYKVFNDELLFDVFLTLENNPSILTSTHAIQFQALCLKWETEKEKFEQEYEDAQWSYPLDDNLKGAGFALAEFCTQPDVRESVRKDNEELYQALKLREEQAGRREANTKTVTWRNVFSKLTFANVILFFATVNGAAAQQLLSKSSSSSKEIGKFRGPLAMSAIPPLSINVDEDFLEEAKCGPVSETQIKGNCIVKIDAEPDLTQTVHDFRKAFLKFYNGKLPEVVKSIEVSSGTVDSQAELEVSRFFEVNAHNLEEVIRNNPDMVKKLEREILRSAYAAERLALILSINMEYADASLLYSYAWAKDPSRFQGKEGVPMLSKFMSAELFRVRQLMNTLKSVHHNDLLQHSATLEELHLHNNFTEILYRVIKNYNDNHPSIEKSLKQAEENFASMKSWPTVESLRTEAEAKKESEKSAEPKKSGKEKVVRWEGVSDVEIVYDEDDSSVFIRKPDPKKTPDINSDNTSVDNKALRAYQLSLIQFAFLFIETPGIDLESLDTSKVDDIAKQSLQYFYAAQEAYKKGDVKNQEENIQKAIVLGEWVCRIAHDSGQYRFNLLAMYTDAAYANSKKQYGTVGRYVHAVRLNALWSPKVLDETLPPEIRARVREICDGSNPEKHALLSGGFSPDPKPIVPDKEIEAEIAVAVIEKNINTLKKYAYRNYASASNALAMFEKDRNLVMAYKIQAAFQEPIKKSEHLDVFRRRGLQIPPTTTGHRLNTRKKFSLDEFMAGAAGGDWTCSFELFKWGMNGTPDEVAENKIDVQLYLDQARKQCTPEERKVLDEKVDKFLGKRSIVFSRSDLRVIVEHSTSGKALSEALTKLDDLIFFYEVMQQQVPIAKEMVDDWDKFNPTYYDALLRLVDSLRALERRYGLLFRDIPNREALAQMGIQLPPAPPTAEVIQAFALSVKNFDNLDLVAKANFYQMWAAQGVDIATLGLIMWHRQGVGGLKKSLPLARLFARLGLVQAITESDKNKINQILVALEPSWLERTRIDYYLSMVAGVGTSLVLLLKAHNYMRYFGLLPRFAAPVQPVENVAERAPQAKADLIAQDAEKKQREKHAENLAILAEIKQKLEMIENKKAEIDARIFEEQWVPLIQKCRVIVNQEYPFAKANELEKVLPELIENIAALEKLVTLAEIKQKLDKIENKKAEVDTKIFEEQWAPLIQKCRVIVASELEIAPPELLENFAVLEKICSAHEHSQKEKQEKEAENKKKHAKLENLKKYVKENGKTIIALRNRVMSLSEVLEKEKSSKQRNETLKHYQDVIAAIELLGIIKNYVLEKHEEIIKAYALLVPELEKFKAIEEKESLTKAAAIRGHRKVLERFQEKIWDVRALSQKYFLLKDDVNNYGFASEETREGFTLACNEIMKQCGEFDAQVNRSDIDDDKLAEHVEHVQSLHESLMPDHKLCQTVEEKKAAMIVSAEENSGKKSAAQKTSAVQKKSSLAEAVGNSMTKALQKGELTSEFPGKAEIEKNPIRAALYWRRDDLALSVQDEADFKDYRLIKYRALQYRLVRFAALLIEIYKNKDNPDFEDYYGSLPEWFTTKAFKNFAENLSNGLMHGYFVMSDSQEAFKESNDPDGLFKCVKYYFANQEYVLSQDVVEKILYSEFGHKLMRAREVEQSIALKLVEPPTALQLLDDCIAKFTELKGNFEHFKDKFTEARKVPVYKDAQKRLLIIIGEIRARLIDWYPEVLVEENKLEFTKLKNDLEKYRMARNTVKHEENLEQAANPFAVNYISDNDVEKIERNALSHIQDLMTLREKMAEFAQVQETVPAKFSPRGLGKK